MKKSDEENNGRDGKAGPSQQQKGAASRRKKSSDDEDANSKRLARTQSVFRPPPGSPARTGSHMEGNDYKSKKADDFMPSMVIPGVKFTPPQTVRETRGSSGEQVRQRSSSAEPRKPPEVTIQRRKTIGNMNKPNAVEAEADGFHAMTFGPQDTSFDTIKAKITVFSPPKPSNPDSKAPAGGEEVASAPKSASEISKSISMKGNGEPQGTSTSRVSKPHESISAPTENLLHTKGKIPTVSEKSQPEQMDPLSVERNMRERHPSEVDRHSFGQEHEKRSSETPEQLIINKPEERSKEASIKPEERSKETSIKPEERSKEASIKLEENSTKPLGHPKGPESLPTLLMVSPNKQTPPQTVRRLPSGRVVIETTRPPKSDATSTSTKPDVGSIKPGEGSTKPDAGPTKPDAGPAKPDVGSIIFKVQQSTPEEHSTKSSEHPNRPESPPTLVLVSPKQQTPSQTVRKLPSGRVVIENTRKTESEPVAKYKGPDISVHTYKPADTNKEVKIQFTIAKPVPKPVLEKRPAPKPPSPPPPPPPPKTIIKPQPIPLKLSVPTKPEPPPEQVPGEPKPRTPSNALLEYLNTISKLTAQELEHDEIPSPEFADDNIDVVQLLKKFNIPDQQRALDSLLDTDSVHYDFGGLMRQYYSYVLRSYSPVNMQDRYRGVTQPANCFTAVDLSQIGTREEEMEKITKAKLKKLDEKRKQLRMVAADEDHFNYLKNLANEQATLLPLTIVHMLNEQMAPILEDVFRFYGKNLGTEHKSTKEAGFHYMKIRKRCEMYTHICGGSTINEDLSSLYK